MIVSQVLPMLVQYFKLFKRGGGSVSQTAITATLHFSDETHANVLWSWKRGICGHHFWQGFPFPNWYSLFEWSLLVTELFKMFIAHSGKHWLYCLLFSFLFLRLLFYFFSSCGPHYSWTANDSQESHNQWILPLSVKTRLDPTCREVIVSSPFSAGTKPWSRFTCTRPPLTRFALQRTSNAPTVTAHSSGSRSRSVKQDFFDHPAICHASGARRGLCF